VALIVVAIVLLSLVLLGAFSGSTASNPATASFSSARNAANATAAAHGTWLLGEAGGLDSANTTNYLFFDPTGFPNCTVTSFTGSIPTNVTLPAYHGNLTTGWATVWALVYYQPSTDAELVVSETGDIVSDAYELSGPTCQAGAYWAQFTGPVGTPIDSPVAVANALEAGGSDFLHNHTRGVSLAINVVGNEGWFVSWTTCSLSPGPLDWFGYGSEFEVVENETTGAVSPNSPLNETCGSLPPIALALGLGTATLSRESHNGTLATQGCTTDDYCYTIPITMASMNVTPGHISIGVFTGVNGGEGVNSVAGYAVLDSTGQVVVYSRGDDTGAPPVWSNGTGTPETLLTTNMQLNVDMGTEDTAGFGYALVISGWGPFNNSPYYAIPLP
jgi:hypothetical protein